MLRYASAGLFARSAVRTTLLRASVVGATQTSAFSSSPLRAAGADPKLKNIVDEIAKLNLMEASALADLLKTTLNIPDAPMMMAGGGGAGAGAGPVAAEEEKKEEQTEFTVKLTKFDEKSKVKLIREVKTLMPNLNLVQAKKFVEGLPQTVKENVPKDEAEKLVKALEAVGGSCQIE
ncbi:hypothetical protein SARC_11598 [Sphaeroforma arctica JP610]|uniref:Ribosomal protein L7/L12 C-terminal domain-containing protein n=1 Tax=Sphaeroforma arctica JP610 TaxID=667725 RepID=A0A0L0FIL0_9EUKA|nr:hypothetical protein SARC_11598 [Sphaeroforma arctica JP610]KNC75883.1 hypothetical protein SARC_11598 [Sphaeroforma arctica JP610]|eukprot:XP_014149785.1 hypothetical protein SARC_11598 [Sphaeroforma arctica JP610]